MSEFYLQALINSADEMIEKAIFFKDKPQPQTHHFMPTHQMHFERGRSLKKKDHIHLYNKGHYSYA